MDTIVESLSQQAATGVIQAEDLVEQAMSDSTPGSRVGEEGLTYFTAPICDFFVTVFELREKNNWLRRQAILIVLQQVLGGTIERYVPVFVLSSLTFKELNLFDFTVNSATASKDFSLLLK